MKRLFFALPLAASLLVACQHQQQGSASAKVAAPTKAASAKTYGAAITETGAVPVSQVSRLLGRRDSVQAKLVGQVSDVCQAKGCWLTMKTADGKQMRVRFKDYGFFVPTTSQGKTVVIDGWLHREEVPVEDLRHYARDAGKSDKEVATITQPEQQLNFEAAGVLLKD